MIVMDTLASPSSPRSPTRMPRKCARKFERYCCLCASYFPLVFVYGLTSWAVWVEATIGFLATKSLWIGNGTSFLGIALYILLNWSYTTAVFTSPGTTTSTRNDYSSLPTHATPATTNFTVKSNGELRFCKKCQAQKPDRSHHCSTCRACVLKMDHHCPWLASCIGLHNYKAFLLFLIYTTLFCWVCFGVSATWVWREILNEGEYTESLMPINYVMLAVISGIIGLVLAGFTGWHILLASRGQTTFECLEKTRYLSPLRKSMQPQHIAQLGQNGARNYVQEPGVEPHNVARGTIPRQDVMAHGEFRQHQTYQALERVRARQRYEEYLDEQDSEKLPSAFDLGWKKNLLHLFGPKRALWALPICNTTGDGWSWEASPKWLAARDRIAREREEQQIRERSAGWGGEEAVSSAPVQSHRPVYSNRSTSKADRILGRSPGQYVDMGSAGGALSMHTLQPRDELDDDYETSSDEDIAERTLDRKADRSPAGGWAHKVGTVTNTLLGNTLARQKDDARGWDGQDEGVD